MLVPRSLWDRLLDYTYNPFETDNQSRLHLDMLAAAPQPAEPQERVLLMRSAEVGRWIQADGRSISGEYRYATLDPKEGEQT